MAFPSHSSPRKGEPVQALTDTHNEYIPPLDFSFKGVTKFSDLLDEEPRPRETETITKPVKPETTKESPKKSDSKAVRLNYNSLDSWVGINDTISNLLINPSILGWLDLSFNQLTTVDRAVLSYPNLSLLYLHGNDISDLKQTIDVLGELQKLRSLTLHGNPIENQFGYRPSILGRCPHLKNFDFSSVTKSDLATAETWKVLYKGKKDGKKKPVSDP